MKNFTSCIKEKQFLKFFYSRLKFKNTQRYDKEFPYLSLCGRERNFIRCDDAQIVFTHIVENEQGRAKLAYAHAGDLLATEFLPHKIYMNPATGSVYHPAWEKVGNIGQYSSSNFPEHNDGWLSDKKPPRTAAKLWLPHKYPRR